LGIILYNLAFESKPFSEFSSGEFNQVRKGNLFTEELINMSNPLLIQLLKMLLKINPKERASASEVISFIEKNIYNNDNNTNLFKLESNINSNTNLNPNFNFNFNFNVNNKTNKNEDLISLKKISFTKKFSDATAKLFKRHSTQFWILKLTNEALDYPPKFKYIKNLVIKSWQKRQKVVKVYINLSTRPLHFISSVAIKSIYILHHYLFLGPPESLTQKEFNLEEFIFSFINLWSMRLTNENYDKEDTLKSPIVTKFIVSYAEFLKSKISFHKKYPFVENNFSLDFFMKSNQDLTMLIEKKFINDLLSHFSFTFQKIVQIPITLKNFSNTINLIITIFNEELISMHFLLFYVIVAYKKYNSNSSSKTENSLKAYDSLFIEISVKVQELFDRLQKYKNELKSTNSLICNTTGAGNALGLGTNSSNVKNATANANANTNPNTTTSASATSSLVSVSEQLINLPNNFTIDYLNNLDSQIKFFPVENFNLRIFFTNEIHNGNGLCLNSSIGRLVDSNLLDRDYITVKKKFDFNKVQDRSKKELNINNNNNNNNDNLNKINNEINTNNININNNNINNDNLNKINNDINNNNISCKIFFLFFIYFFFLIYYSLFLIFFFYTKFLLFFFLIFYFS
jgi:hypothetical protein